VTEQTFGELARQTRIDKQVSLAELAYRISAAGPIAVGPPFISAIERGEPDEIARHLARQWAEALGADPDEWQRVAERDLSVGVRYGVSRCMAFLDYADGHGEMKSLLQIVYVRGTDPEIKPFGLIAGPFDTRAEAEGYIAEHGG
jgi:transcriptional regulator with XRE-family HTH domain